MMTGKSYNFLFNEFPQRFCSIFLGMMQDGNLAIDLAYNLQELIAADTPEAQETALFSMNVTSSQLANLATESNIDLSDPERLKPYTGVRKKCLSRLLLDVPTMSTSQVSNFIDEHVHFLIKFDELNTSELAHRQKALARA